MLILMMKTQMIIRWSNHLSLPLESAVVTVAVSFVHTTCKENFIIVLNVILMFSAALTICCSLATRMVTIHRRMYAQLTNKQEEKNNNDVHFGEIRLPHKT